MRVTSLKCCNEKDIYGRKQKKKEAWWGKLCTQVKDGVEDKKE
jgi:hypothetical protein